MTSHKLFTFYSLCSTLDFMRKHVYYFKELSSVPTVTGRTREEDMVGRRPLLLDNCFHLLSGQTFSEEP